jgi:biopolymer transport protein ExbB/TolQ
MALKRSVALQSDMTKMVQELIKRGILWSGFHTLSYAHADDDILYTLDVYREVLPMLQSGRFKEVHSVTEKSDAAIGKIVSHGLQRMQSPGRREDIDAAMEEGMMEVVPRLEKRTHYIATFANVITLVGLLGTILGLIKAFTAVANVNPAEKAELLSAGISIAMNNTAFALMVAIPFLLVHSFLQSRATEIVDSLEAAKITFLNLVQRLGAEAQPAR